MVFDSPQLSHKKQRRSSLCWSILKDDDEIWDNNRWRWWWDKTIHFYCKTPSSPTKTLQQNACGFSNSCNSPFSVSCSSPTYLLTESPTNLQLFSWQYFLMAISPAVSRDFPVTNSFCFSWLSRATPLFSWQAQTTPTAVNRFGLVPLTVLSFGLFDYLFRTVDSRHYIDLSGCLLTQWEYLIIEYYKILWHLHKNSLTQ